MRKYNFLFFSALLFLFACKWSKTPSGIIEPNKMVNLLTALHIVDGSVSNGNQTQDSLYINGTGKYIALFKSFHTDSAQFRNSMKYYSGHPDQFEIMYTQILKNLQKKNDSVNRPLPSPKSKNALPKK